MNETPKVSWWQPGLAIFMRMSGWIGGPVLLALVIGKWLDKKYGTEPWLFLLSVGTAFVVSMFGIVRDATQEMKKIDKKEEKNERNKE